MTGGASSPWCLSWPLPWSPWPVPFPLSWPWPRPSPPCVTVKGDVVGAGARVGVADGCCDAVTRTATTGATWITTEAAVAGAVVAGAAVGCGAGAAGCGVGAAGAEAGAGFGATGVDGATRRTMTGFGFATGRRRSVGAARDPSVGATASSGGKTAGSGSVAAWTSAGCASPGRAEKAGVSLPDGQARKRGITAAAATAPASKIAATMLSIELMFLDPDADSITRTSYRQHGAGA